MKRFGISDNIYCFSCHQTVLTIFNSAYVYQSPLSLLAREKFHKGIFYVAGEKKQGREGGGWLPLYSHMKKKHSDCKFSKGLAAGSMLDVWVHPTQSAVNWLGCASFALLHGGAQKRLQCNLTAALCVNSSFEICEHVANNVISRSVQCRIPLRLTSSLCGFILQKLPQTMNFIKMQMSDLHLLMQLS